MATGAGNQIPFGNRFVDRNGGELRQLICARDKVSAATRPKQLGVPNVVTIGEDDFRDRLHHVKALGQSSSAGAGRSTSTVHPSSLFRRRFQRSFIRCPARRILRRPGSARRRFHEGYNSGRSIHCCGQVWIADRDQ
jgi:hypothetical protein